MAVLQKIRSHGPLLVIVIGLGLFAFIAGDAWKVLQPHQGQRDVGEINGETISAQDYQKLVDEYSEVVKMTTGNNSLGEQQLNQVKDQVWQNLVNNIVIEEEAGKLGLTVTDKEMQDIIAKGTNPVLMNTPFRNPQTGMFDQDMLKKFLADYDMVMKSGKATGQQYEYYHKLGAYWLFIEKSIRQGVLAEKYASLVSNSMISNPVEAEDIFNGSNTQTDAEVVAIPYTSVADADVKVSESEIKKLYDSRKEMYRQPMETRDFKYIDVVVTPSEEDRAEVLDEVNEYVEKLKNNDNLNMSTFIRSTGSAILYSTLPVGKDKLPADVKSRLEDIKVGEVYGPFYNEKEDSYNAFKFIGTKENPGKVSFRQLQVVEETPEKTEAKVAELLKDLNNGADFAELAKKMGQNTEATELDMTQFEGAAMNPDNARLINSVMNAEKGKWNKLNLGMGYILYEVTDKSDFAKKYDMAIIKRPVEFSKETYNDTYNKFSSFVAKYTTAEEVENNAEEAGYRLLESADFAAAQHYVGGVSNTREVLKWIFESSKGRVSPLFECGNNDHMMMIILTDIHPEGYRDIKLLSSQLRTELVREKKAELIMKSLEGDAFKKALANKDMKKDTINHITFDAPVYVQMTNASEPVLCACAEVTPADKVSAPVKGNAAVYVMKVLNKKEGDEKFDALKVENQRKLMLSRFASMFINDLYMKANVKDNRYLYF